MVVQDSTRGATVGDAEAFESEPFPEQHAAKNASAADPENEKVEDHAPRCRLCHQPCDYTHPYDHRPVPDIEEEAV